MVKVFLRLEALFIFLFAIFLYQQLSGDWILFTLLILTPDLSMVGYLKDKDLGAKIYNLGHNYILGLAILAFGLINSNQLTTNLGLIFIAHVGIDRFFGFGLKYPSGFKDTHIQKL